MTINEFKVTPIFKIIMNATSMSKIYIENEIFDSTLHKTKKPKKRSKNIIQ